ncbi:MAG: TIGR00730 family Rossman fold protein [Anaerolineales bacterium]|nr:TIGR00730 family Rossman fold protein [Anaerolineales bacterium]
MSKRICVYCGSSDKVAEKYLAAAKAMGAALAKNGHTLVFGGGGTGLMGALADAALAHGGYVVGIIPDFFNTEQLVHTGLSELHVVESMHIRKARMAEMSDGFIALPGGFGTFEEIFEILTWAQIGLHQKPVAVCNVHGYFEPLLDLIEHARDEGFLYAEHRSLLLDDSEPERLLQKMASFRTPENLSRWVDRDVSA